MCCAGLVTPCQANIIKIVDGKLSIHSGKDLESRQIAKIVSELDISQFAVFKSWARWYGDILERGPRRGIQFIAVDGDLAIRRPLVLAPNPKRKGVNPESAIRCVWTGAELSNQFEARPRGPVNVEASPGSIYGKLWCRMRQKRDARWRHITEVFFKIQLTIRIEEWRNVGAVRTG